MPTSLVLRVHRIRTRARFSKSRVVGIRIIRIEITKAPAFIEH